MASRKEQKERLRRERLEREQASKQAERRKRTIGYVTAGGLAAVAAIVIVVLLVGGGDGDGAGAGGQEVANLLPDGGAVPARAADDIGAAARQAGCETESTEAESREHTTDPAQPVDYQLNPPTSGRHYEIPAEDGMYAEPPPDTALVHTLEHGRVIIWFKPGLPEPDRANLKALFDQEEGYQLVLTPRREMPYEVAATAWNREPEPNGTGRLLGCPQLTDESFAALQAFMNEHRGNGPEPIP